MFNFYCSLSKTKKIVFLVITFILSIPLGGIAGFFLGLVSTTFIPMCCDESGCHNCFEFRGMFGHEATGTIGLWAGMILFPLLYALLIAYWEIKKKKISKK
jgi:hypothetical protein